MSVLDVAWVAFDDPAVGTKVHRVSLTTGALVCADWVTTEGAGYRIPEEKINSYGRRCTTCWPHLTAEQENPR